MPQSSRWYTLQYGLNSLSFLLTFFRTLRLTYRLLLSNWVIRFLTNLFDCHLEVERLISSFYQRGAGKYLSNLEIPCLIAQTSARIWIRHIVWPQEFLSSQRIVVSGNLWTNFVFKTLPSTPPHRFSAKYHLGNFSWSAHIWHKSPSSWHPPLSSPKTWNGQ
jgi:hypothetical protein